MNGFRRAAPGKRKGRPTCAKLVAGLLTAVAPLSGIAPAEAQNNPGPTVFTGVSILPMTSDTVLSGRTVVVGDGMITAVGSADEIEAPRGATVIDGTVRKRLEQLREAVTG